MHEEALVADSPSRVAIGEGLERGRALVARVADRGEEERLHHPRARAVDEVRAGDEHGVVGRRAGRQLGRAREEPRRPVLHRAEHAAVVVVVDASPRRPTRPRPARSSALLSTRRPAVRDCHQTQSWQTAGARSRASRRSGRVEPCASRRSGVYGARSSRRLRPREEAERDERRAEAGERCSVPPGRLVDAADVGPADVRQPQLPPGQGTQIWPRVQVAGENEVERACRKPVDDVREVAEQDAQVGVRVGELLGVRPAVRGTTAGRRRRSGSSGRAARASASRP